MINLFQKISLACKITKAVKEVKKLKETNSPIIDELVAIVGDLIQILERIKALIPSIGELVEAIINNTDTRTAKYALLKSSNYGNH